MSTAPLPALDGEDDEDLAEVDAAAARLGADLATARAIHAGYLEANGNPRATALVRDELARVAASVDGRARRDSRARVRRQGRRAQAVRRPRRQRRLADVVVRRAAATDPHGRVQARDVRQLLPVGARVAAHADRATPRRDAARVRATVRRCQRGRRVVAARARPPRAPVEHPQAARSAVRFRDLVDNARGSDRLSTGRSTACEFSRTQGAHAGVSRAEARSEIPAHGSGGKKVDAQDPRTLHAVAMRLFTLFVTPRGCARRAIVTPDVPISTRARLSAGMRVIVSGP